MLKLRIRIKGSKLHYSIPLWGKLPYALIVAVVVYGLFLDWEAPLLPIIFGTLSLIGLLYRESWVFDNERRTITGLFGIGPLVKRQVVSYDEVSMLQITHFLRGTMNDEAQEKDSKRKGRKKPIICFSAKLRSDEEVKIEIIEESKSAGRTEQAARAIGAFTNLDYQADREPESGPRMNVTDLPKSGIFR
ncbi:MAG: hypothetical protein PHI83_09400 [Sphaerochaetaceae bacterium]|jgi:hypothetical protein|nr:hypothetical protein [Sphaerochaetaceae bacterium]